MFTIAQIEAAHNKVKSGEDFPRYVKEIKEMGIKSHEVVLSDGIWIFKGTDEQVIQINTEIKNLHVSEQPSLDKFKHILYIHQKGESDYNTFCIEAAKAGVERWISNFEDMKVTYFDLSGKPIDVEQIPSLE